MAVAGDDSAPVFDNAVDELQQLLAARGAGPVDRFTSDPTMAGADRPIATAEAMEKALTGAPPRAGEGCLVFITSHGSRDGVLMRDDLDSRQNLDPSALGRILDAGCGRAPTVAIVSACFSGTWRALFRATEVCVERKESALGFQHSEPQAYFGSAVADLALP